MIKDAKIYNVFISCPGDVQKEIKEIEAVLKYYNSTFGYTNFIQLMPRYWLKDSYPASGKDVQQILFDQFIGECDFVIVVFWTRLGMPTPRFDSGSVEEIDYFRSHNKQVLLYFSDCLINPSLIDLKQYKKVRDFKRCIEKERKCLYYEYETLEDFSHKLWYNIYKYMEQLIKS